MSGYDFKIQLYTVPGQVQYNATRRVVLAGADAVVFVADARRSLAKENQAAFENMKVNLLANRLVPEKVPLVLQYNKQDLPEVMSEAELNKTLNPWGRPALAAVAAQGKGVIECFVAVVQDMLAAIAVKYNLKEKGLDPAERSRRRAGGVRGGAEEAAAAAAPAAAAGRPRRRRVRPRSWSRTRRTRCTPPRPRRARRPGLVSEELLHRSLRSNVELAESLAGLVREMNLGLATILSQAELLMFYREDARDKRQVAIAAIQQEAARLQEGRGRPRRSERGRGGRAERSPGIDAYRTSSAPTMLVRRGRGPVRHPPAAASAPRPR